MLESICPPQTQAEEDEKVVVLLLPEALGGLADPARMRATLSSSPAAVRVLVCLTEKPDQPLVTMLAELGVKAEILLGPKVEPPVTTAFILRTPPGTSPQDQVEFAVALSDVVLIASLSGQSPLIRHAVELKKPMIVPGDPLPAVPPLTNATDGLDPDMPGLHAWGRRCFGRLEQAIMECLAFAWLGWNTAGRAESRKRLRKCAGLAWRPGAYFAPEEWKKLAPDRGAVDTSSKIVARFDAMDRSALHGSYIHRDFAWVAHLGAAFAVVAAVAGQLSPEHAKAWGITELVTLVVVALLVIGARCTNLQDRWMACRLGAEQLRIARMSLPLLVLPPALATTDMVPGGDGRSSKDFELGFVALADVKRVIRDQGLPRLDPGLTPALAATWLQLIVADQIEYHSRNHRKLERTEKCLRIASQMIFGIAMIAVVAHFSWHAKWLLLFTAAGPALAAALHGAGTRLGIVHRAALSLDMERELTRINRSLTDLIETPPPAEHAWPKVRRLAYEAAKTMGTENTSWHGLVRRYRDELP